LLNISIFYYVTIHGQAYIGIMIDFQDEEFLAKIYYYTSD